MVSRHVGIKGALAAAHFAGSVALAVPERPLITGAYLLIIMTGRASASRDAERDG
jgi:hypothetical protein